MDYVHIVGKFKLMRRVYTNTTLENWYCFLLGPRQHLLSVLIGLNYGHLESAIFKRTLFLLTNHPNFNDGCQNLKYQYWKWMLQLNIKQTSSVWLVIITYCVWWQSLRSVPFWLKTVLWNDIICLPKLKM